MAATPPARAPDRSRASGRPCSFVWILALALAGLQYGRAQAAGFAALCEANQVYDTGRPTSADDRRLCRCVEGRLDAKGDSVAIEVFQKVLAARRAGLGLHPSQVDLDELVALMSFSASLQACGDQLKLGRAAF